MKIEISEKKGELNFGIVWISLDGRLNSKWFQTFKSALKHYKHLKKLRRQPSFNVHVEYPFASFLENGEK